MTAIVLLPGMDGTGLLFTDFVRALDATTIVVAYPGDAPLGYAELEQLVLASLPTDEPYILLGESFSGPLAMAIAAQRPPLLQAVILVCTFARLPVPRIPGWLQRLVGSSAVVRVPLALTARMVLGSFYSRRVYALLEKVHGMVTPAVWKARLRAVLAIDQTALLSRIEVPVLCLRATRDRVVFRPASRVIARHLPQVRVVDIDAPHFLLQTKPAEAAAAIEAFAREHGISLSHDDQERYVAAAHL